MGGFTTYCDLCGMPPHEMKITKQDRADWPRAHQILSRADTKWMNSLSVVLPRMLINHHISVTDTGTAWRGTHHEYQVTWLPEQEGQKEMKKALLVHTACWEALDQPKPPKLWRALKDIKVKNGKQYIAKGLVDLGEFQGQDFNLTGTMDDELNLPDLWHLNDPRKDQVHQDFLHQSLGGKNHKCEARTRQNKNCKRWARKGFNTCHSHR